MQLTALAGLALVAPSSALIRFGCSQLVVERLDPLVTPGQLPSPHVHQIIGGNSFNTTMDPAKDMPGESTCTTCQFSEDFSNYWTAVLYFKALNGSFHRVSQIPNAGFTGQQGGMTVYYMQDGLANTQQTSQVTAFKPGFRMLIGDPSFRSKAESKKYRQLTYTCLKTIGTRFPETTNFPTSPCPAGIMANMRFPRDLLTLIVVACWDGKNLDSPNHQDHMSYPETSTFEAGAPCPASHPVRTPQLMYEVIFDTSPFNNKSDWPVDGSQPFYWSQGDKTGFGTHGDYMFGWKADALQRVMDSSCYVNCPTLKTQSIADMNMCAKASVVDEKVDGWLPEIPGYSTVM